MSERNDNEQGSAEERTATEGPKRFGSFTRRSFLSQLGAAGLAATASPVLGQAVQPGVAGTDAPTPAPPKPGAIAYTLKVNGTEHRMNTEPRVTLLDALREHLSLTGTKKGCDHGQCGACTVHVNGRRINSCLAYAAMLQGEDVTTIEGLGTPDQLHPMQAAFVQHDGYQCGYCTSGQIMSAVAVVKEPWGKGDHDVKEAMAGNICRCGAYPNIVAAVQQVRGYGPATAKEQA